ncbi:antitermination protein Q [Xenorhabdus mauleonii]|uniref:Antitermination protein Q n=1 Tax=Xenorhabdus mauleonii TaxID=351675 RepID=A0A1I3WMV3_9GAMM|nr:antiterminator Q family protein [Xenorhabdus mauleonii]PHM39287.1 antitermination protein Q [Xenorhabdus mauleonii]SFK08815.1 Phage antitermination protein Q [Xenorhabdus mauleonii]
MRDIQQVLVLWGGWTTSDVNLKVGWSPVAAGFSGLLPASGNNRPTCSDEDGLIIDICVARLRARGKGEELEYIKQHYIHGLSKREIGRKYEINEKEVRHRILCGESFIEGCLEMLDIQLDMDLSIKKQTIKH